MSTALLRRPDAIARATDLRRRRTRHIAETLVDHARHAAPDDRAVINAIYREGMTVVAVATLRGVNPRRLRRRVRALVANLLSEKFLFVLAHHERWPRRRRTVADACVLQGRSMRAAARHLRVSLHAVRREMAAVDALFSAAATHRADRAA